MKYLLALSLVCIGATAIGAQERAAFSQPEAVANAFDSSPDRAIRVLEAHLSQAQLDAIEEALLPPRNTEEKLERLKDLKRRAARSGVDEQGEMQSLLDAQIRRIEEGKGQEQ